MESNNKFIRVCFNNEGKYIQAAETLNEFKENFIKGFHIDNNNKNYFLFCRDKSHRTTKIESEESYQKYKNFFIKYPKLIQPFFIEEEKPSFKNFKCSECNMNPIEGIMYKCLNCKDYNLCEKCEKNFGEKHGHPLLMLRKEKYLTDFKKHLNDNDKNLSI